MVRIRNLHSLLLGLVLCLGYVPATGGASIISTDLSIRQSPLPSVPGDHPDSIPRTADVERPNRPPVANNDAYSMDQDHILDVPPMGILENDQDPDADLLSANYNEGPDHGKLVVNSDGSFTYTPNTDFAGRDGFTYYAQDFMIQSELAVVEILVKDTALPSVEWISPVTTSGRYDTNWGKLLLQVEAEDNVAIDRVKFYRWDAANYQWVDIVEIDPPAFEAELETRALNMEWNQIFAEAYDSSGNKSERQFIWVYRSPPVLYLPLALNQ